MAYYAFPLLILFGFGIVMGSIWLSIHYYWKNQEKKGKELSQLAKQWMSVSKPVGYFFFILPIIIIPIVWLLDKLLYLFLLIPITLAAIGMIGKK